jgi:hypothetical protein
MGKGMTVEERLSAVEKRLDICETYLSPYSKQFVDDLNGLLRLMTPETAAEFNKLWDEAKRVRGVDESDEPEPRRVCWGEAYRHMLDGGEAVRNHLRYKIRQFSEVLEWYCQEDGVWKPCPLEAIRRLLKEADSPDWTIG